jgi:hypothetical protein
VFSPSALTSITEVHAALAETLPDLVTARQFSA